jgi:hypothetical protein
MYHVLRRIDLREHHGFVVLEPLRMVLLPHACIWRVRLEDTPLRHTVAGRWSRRDVAGAMESQRLSDSNRGEHHTAGTHLSIDFRERGGTVPLPRSQEKVELLRQNVRAARAR